MHKISSNELVTFTCYLSCFLFPGFGDTFILETAKNSSIISVLLGFLLGFIPLFLIIYLFKQTKDKNIFELNKERLKFFGSILNLLLVIGMIYIIILGMINIVDFTISQFLTRTSYYLLCLVMISLIIIALIKKTEVVGRTCLVLIFFFIGTFLFSVIFLIPKVDLNNYLPIFDVNKSRMIKAVLMYPSFGILPLVSLLFLKSDRIDNKKKIPQKILLGYLLGSILVITFIYLIIGVFGIDIGVLFTYPEYTLFKKIQAFNFIGRIENIISSIIFITSLSSICLLFSFILHYLKGIFKIKQDKSYNITIIIVCLGVSLLSIYLFRNFPVIMIFTKYHLFSSSIYFVLILNALLIFLTKKRTIIHS